jgi:hypothetical protein
MRCEMRPEQVVTHRAAEDDRIPQLETPGSPASATRQCVHCQDCDGPAPDSRPAITGEVTFFVLPAEGAHSSSAMFRPAA